MVKKIFDIIGGSNYGISTLLDNQRTINMYVHTDEVSKRKCLLPCAGLSLVATSEGTNKNRLLYTPTVVGTQESPSMFSIMGNEVFLYDDQLVETKLAELKTNSGYVGVAANNGGQVLFVDGADGYLYDIAADTWTEGSTITGFPADPIDVAFKDGFFIVVTESSDVATANQMFVSGDQGQSLNDGTKWNPVDTETFTTKADTLRACAVVGNNLFLIGRRFTEIWQNLTDENIAGTDFEFPFAPNRSYALEFGVTSVGTVREGFGYLLWLGNDENGVSAVMISAGERPVAISTKAITAVIDSYSTNEIEQASADIREENGHILYTLNFPNNTLVYDVEEKVWFEQQQETGKRHIAENHAYFVNKHLVGDYRNTNIYEVRKENDTYNNEPIRRTRISKEFSTDEELLIRINSVELDLKSALGQTNDPNSDPEVFLSFSKDKGITYSRKVGAKVGKIGRTKHRTIWYNLGTGFSYTFKFEYLQGGEFSLLNATVDYDILEK